MAKYKIGHVYGSVYNFQNKFLLFLHFHYNQNFQKKKKKWIIDLFKKSNFT